MPLIKTPLIKTDRKIADDYTHIGDGDAVPATGGVIVSLRRLEQDRTTLFAGNRPVGVVLSSDQSPELIAAPDLARLALVAITFPKFRDGRGFSWARMLRERLRFTGEIRAVGDFLIDQIFFMARCGFDAFETGNRFAAADVVKALATFSDVYQPSADGRAPVWTRRHA